jgi:hypothetical protein
MMGWKSIPWNKVQNIYLMHSPELGLYKIGITGNLSTRLAQIRSASAFPIELVAVWETPVLVARSFESLIHEKYSYCRTHGEWFKLEADDVAQMLAVRNWVVPAVLVIPPRTKNLRLHPFHVEELIA